MQESIETKRTELEQRLSLETLLAETSTRFINVPADRIDSEIEDAQRHICESLDIDILAVWQLSNEDPVARWCDRDSPRGPTCVNHRSCFGSEAISFRGQTDICFERG